MCSAGNNGRTDVIVGHDSNGEPIYQKVRGEINSPGNSPYAVTVGATDSRTTARRSDDTVAQFSSKGPTPYDRFPKPDLVAPGRRLVAACRSTIRRWAGSTATASSSPRARRAAQSLLQILRHVFLGPGRRRRRRADVGTNRSHDAGAGEGHVASHGNTLPDSNFISKVQNILRSGAGAVNAVAAVQMARAITRPPTGSMPATQSSAAA